MSERAIKKYKKVREDKIEREWKRVIERGRKKEREAERKKEREREWEWEWEWEIDR